MQLHEIQKQLKAPKNQRNTFGNYNYRNAEDILEAVKPLLENSILTLSDEIVQIGNRYYVKATATFQCGEQTATAYGWAREPENRKGMDESQITGATSSYARKYALNGLFILDDTKDPDNGPPPTVAQPKTQGRSKKPAEAAPKADSKPPADETAWGELRSALKAAGIGTGSKELARACVQYVTSKRISFGDCYNDAAKCQEAVTLLKAANEQFPADSKDSLLSQLKKGSR